ncbi:signal peptidase I [Alteromonas sp. SM 2104]|nr:signal peptidase I [Alteromonas oceanisediminis]
MLLLFACRSSIADWYHVPSGSMLPTIVEGDRVFVDKMAYRLDVPFTDIAIMQTGDPQRGDIVTFNSEAADIRLIKRIIGLPGDRIAMQDNRLFVNGEAVEYEMSKDQLVEHLPGHSHVMQLTEATSSLRTFGYIDVPDNHYLVLGDNRNHSVDSRVYGFVPRHELSGKATRVLASFDLDNFYIPRGDRWFIALR